ncbi:hypothetical protein DPMN_018556 [Dreissena polymorpha]|uniref:Uncharacterized protein n=1 Tax=Dreissena polymorpha TaxID=45954 RepID=A0A9D4NIM0_DREPO|nr:hypothetical protein DPMN_018556 [Dreissena polymorpha]
MGTKHLNGDSLFQISCDMKEYNFRCEGCKSSSKLWRHKSLEFVKVDDVVPLFTRNTSSSGINIGCTSFHAVRSFLYWWIILVVLLAAIISIMTGNFPFERLKFVFTRNVSASRINYGCTRLHAVQSFHYRWNVFLVYLATITSVVKNGFHKITGSVSSLRIRDKSFESEHGVSPKGVGEGILGLNLATLTLPSLSTYSSSPRSVFYFSTGSIATTAME